MRTCTVCTQTIDQDESHCHNPNCEKPVKTERNITVLNRSTVKKYALAVSETRRAGKFTRVGEEFFLRCEANLEAAIRRVGEGPASDAPAVVPGTTFITRTARDKVEEQLENLAKRIVFLEVLRHPSMGCTLK